jgi:hypothetical protein
MRDEPLWVEALGGFFGVLLCGERGKGYNRGYGRAEI